MALIESLLMNESSDFTFYVICLDDLTYTFLEKLNFKNVTLIEFSKIEYQDNRLQKAKNDRSPSEYIWTAKSSIILFLFKTFPQIEALCYLDADMFFFQPPDPIWKELNQNSVLIHEHRFVEEQSKLIQFGLFNAGLLCFCNDTNGNIILNWWRNKVLEWCFERVENDKYADQGYLNFFPNFPGVKVIQHIGVGVAPWNHIQYKFSKNENDQVIVNESPLIVYHFHSVVIDGPELILPSSNVAVPFTLNIISLCYIRYLDALSKSLLKIRTIQPDFSFGLYGKNNISWKHSFIAHKSVQNTFKEAKIPHKLIVLSGNWDFYALHQLREEKPVPPLKTDKYFSDISPDYIFDEAEKELFKGNTSTAILLLTKITEKWPQYYLAFNDLGVIYWKSGNKQNAFNYIKKAYELNPIDANIVKNMSNILIDLNENELAQKVLSNYSQNFSKQSLK